MENAFQFERRVWRDIVRGRLVDRGDRVVVGVSGGPDSLALLAVLRALALEGLGPELVVAHLNHCLRGAAADRDALLVSSLARAWGLPVVLGESEALATASSAIEERARAERSAFLARVARSVGASAVALGHTLDDQAETVLMRLGRGAGPAALGAMRTRRADGVVRPLLGLRRAECARYLEALGIRSIEDASNLDMRFTRNRLRREVLPALSEGLGVDAAVRLADLARQLQVESELAEAHVNTLLGGETVADLPVAAVRSAGEAAGRVVRTWLLRQGMRLGRRQIGAIVELACREAPSSGIDAGAGVRVSRRYDRLVVLRPEPVQPPPVESLDWPIPGALELPSGWLLSASLCDAGSVHPGSDPPDGLELTIDAGRAPAALTVRRPRPGDRIRLRAGRRKLSDVLIDARIPRPERSSLAVVSQGADIIWVPGIAAGWVDPPGPRSSTFVVLRAEPLDCRSDGRVVKSQEFRVSFA